MIAIQCSQCGKKYNAPDRYAGKAVKCPQCGGAIPVPAAASESYASPLMANLLDEELTSGPVIAVAAPQPAPTRVTARPEKERFVDNEKTRKTLEGISYMFIGVAALIIAPAMAPGWWIHSDFLAENGYLLAALCGIGAGICQGHVYGPRYYFIYIIGMLFGAILTVVIMSSFLNHVRVINCPRFILLFITIIGAAPGFILARTLKKIQDFVYPPSEEELARHRQIDLARKAERKEYSTYSARETGYRSGLIFLCLLSIIPPIGFILSLLVYAGNESGSRARRAGIIGMVLSIVVFIAYVCIYFYVDSLAAKPPRNPAPVVPIFNMPALAPPAADNHRAQPPADPPAMQKEPEDIPPRDAKPAEPRQPVPAKLENPPPIPADLLRMLKKARPAKPADDLDALARQLQWGDGFERKNALDELLTVDVKKAPKDVVKSVAKGMKQIAFDEQASPWDRRKAIEGMVKWGGAYSVPVLIELLQSSDDPQVHEACFQAFSIHKDPRAIEPVAKLYLTNFFDESAGKCLAVYGSDAEPAVLKYFPPTEYPMVVRGINFMKKYGTKKSIQPLLSLRRYPGFFAVSDKVADAVNTIQQREKDRQKKK
jgi:hypothetical protein